MPKKYHRAYRSRVVHPAVNCRHLVKIVASGNLMTVTEQKPRDCTVCDNCQYLARMARKAK